MAYFKFKYFRRQSLHCLLLLFIIVYAFCGGLIFYKLENDALESSRNEKIAKTNLCIAQILQTTKKFSYKAVKHIESCWKDDIDAAEEWNYITSTLYGFGIMTTLVLRLQEIAPLLAYGNGALCQISLIQWADNFRLHFTLPSYNRIAPITAAGRIFSIFYGIFGIPITMIALSITGRKLNAFVIKCKQKLAIIQMRNRKREGNLDSIENQKESKETEEISSGFATFIILTIFLIYLVFGALLLPLLNGEIDFINGFYYNFLCLTAIDFGQLIPQRIAFLPVTFAYVCFGLALVTIAIDDGSKYAKKLQHLGKKIKNAAATKIWFGGKTLKVGEVLHAVGKKCGVDPAVIDKIDLDDLIEEVIAINEGKLPAIGTDEENSPESELLPEATIVRSPTKESFEMDPCFSAEDAVSMISSELHSLGTYCNEKVVVTQVFEKDEIAEAFGFDQAKVMALVLEEIIEPSTYMAKINTVTSIIDTKDPKLLRKFEEKKKLFGSDPQNLLKIYEEEWKRVENLTTRRRQPNDRSQRSGSGQPNDQPLVSDQSQSNNSTTQMSSKRLRSRGASAIQGSSSRKDSKENKQS